MKPDIFTEILERIDNEDWEMISGTESKAMITACITEIQKLRSALFEITISHGMSPAMYQNIAKKALVLTSH